jgi:hypothetical protein
MSLQAVEGLIDENGTLKNLGNVTLPKSRRVIITILDEEPSCSCYLLFRVIKKPIL